jgi:hypothetical protein
MAAVQRRGRAELLLSLPLSPPAHATPLNTHALTHHSSHQQEGDLKYMVAFSSPVTALEWCLTVQVRAVCFSGWPLWHP